MAEKNTGGPDLMKMLQMMMPYMDEQSGRMLRIMLKMRELQELMQPPPVPQAQQEHREAAEAADQSMQADTRCSAVDQGAVSLQDFVTQRAGASGPGVTRQEAAVSTSPTVPVLGQHNTASSTSDLAAQLREGLTPEQQSMMASISGMWK